MSWYGYASQINGESLIRKLYKARPRKEKGGGRSHKGEAKKDQGSIRAKED